MQGSIKPPLPTTTRKLLRGLRRTSTEAEQKLWYHLRDSRLNGYKFRRQHAVPPYVVDFYCEAKRLVVELDGSQHNEQSDQIRTQYLVSQGMAVLRFWDNEALQQTDAVLEAILSALEHRTLTPNPSPDGRGEY
ncbi:endonuclease domain-containing protein [Dyella dinghuensis]|uniref:Endonuclease domain-containing protein n=1 Tax=Dyella dinghuensis TaxID=1920169 RepID=A0A3S0S3Q8_9GAMM|nr:endonuclease domain-containing protein [Dyella dinghuensis]